MRPEDVPGFVSKPGRRIEPLGGREADGFGEMVETMRREMRFVLERFDASDYSGESYGLCRDARDQYDRIGKMLERARREVTEHSRDHLETELIHDVITSHAWAVYARDRAAAGLPDDGERTCLQMSGAYLRSTITLAMYTGTDQLTVNACQGDQDALMALVNTRGDL